MQQVDIFGSIQKNKDNEIKAEVADEIPTYKNLPKTLSEAYKLRNESIMHFNHWLKLAQASKRKT